MPDPTKPSTPDVVTIGFSSQNKDSNVTSMTNNISPLTNSISSGSNRSERNLGSKRSVASSTNSQSKNTKKTRTDDDTAEECVEVDSMSMGDECSVTKIERELESKPGNLELLNALRDKVYSKEKSYVQLELRKGGKIKNAAYVSKSIQIAKLKKGSLSLIKSEDGKFMKNNSTVSKLFVSNIVFSRTNKISRVGFDTEIHTSSSVYGVFSKSPSGVRICSAVNL